MALLHATQGEVIDVRPHGTAIEAAQSVALFKSAHLEVLRLVFPAGHRMPSHQVAGEITIQCLEGEVEVEVAGRTTTLSTGQLLFAEGGEPHALHALQPTSVLVTIALR
ncbi:cupin domain-containing protein [Ottowia sp.]|uniref:cupin domain-containing protein n=1 Tax=Ottowia sp. TaxID=1898956 RepID=UPI003A8A5F01